MSSVDDVFFRIQGIKKEQRTLRTMYRDALKSSVDYQEIKTQIERLAEKKREVEQKIKNEFSKEMEKLEELKDSLTDDAQLLADMVLSKLVKGEVVKVIDAYNTTYNPVVKVTFKKAEDEQSE